MRVTAAILFLYSAGCLAQQKTDTLQFYFQIDESQNSVHDRRIDSLTAALKDKVFNVWIYGYADFLHSSSYNQKLSQQRAEGIKARLKQNVSAPQMNLLACEGKGEKFSQDNGEAAGDAYNRRVVLIYEINPANRVVNTRPVKIDPPVEDAAPLDIAELKSKGKITLEGLGFIPGRHAILPSSEPVLRRLLTTMLRNPQLRIEIHGHICCWNQDGDGYDFDTGEMNLSLRRAKTVYDYLIENGVEADRMRYKGFGHTRPRVKEVSPETEQMNRRVDIEILD